MWWHWAIYRRRMCIRRGFSCIASCMCRREGGAEMTFKPLDRAGIAARIAQDIPEGWFVNLGIGIPTGVSDYVPLDREVIFHSENGVIGAGPAPDADRVNPYLLNAGTQHITLRT